MGYVSISIMPPCARLVNPSGRAGAEGRIAGYQVCDWVLPLAADPLLSRGYVGDGYVDLSLIHI